MLVPWGGMEFIRLTVVTGWSCLRRFDSTSVPLEQRSLRAASGGAALVVRGLVGDLHVVRVGLGPARRRDTHEAGTGAQ